jgi:hypothetical protein
MASKNRGLRQGTAATAMTAAPKVAGRGQSSSPLEGKGDKEKEAIVGLTVRLPNSMYGPLLDIVTEAKKRGEKISIHSLMLEGIAKVIAERHKK